uniref:Uncharacterized protein n=1 Tax=Erythrolobus madagascarensis TaxID=708628 RepID=A0A7S0XJ52_9RHOD|mmetsp:Transcript_2899/g.6265  ORF Transcript_2899/g.6265 Transcript_2899/m.6265 type:complete len:105 (+) Transcript_2899:267-581(+)
MRSGRDYGLSTNRGREKGGISSGTRARLGQVSLLAAVLGIFLGLVGWGCIVGTILHVGHHRNTAVNIPLALLSLLTSFRLLMPAWMAFLGAPGYSIPIELQDLL